MSRNFASKMYALRTLAYIIVAGLCLTDPAYGSDLRNAGWPTYGYTLANTRHVDFSQINSHTVNKLALAWKFRTGVYGGFEASPIIVGRTMYVTTGVHSVVALDATNGALLWRYESNVGPVSAILLVNRGVAVDAGMVFFATLDDKLIALDERTGAKRWETQIVDPAAGYSETMAPLAWRGLVFIGTAGGERNIRGCFSAYSQTTGKLIWRWWSVSAGWEGQYVNAVQGMSLGRDIASEKRDAKKYRDAWREGGGPIWMTPALDPARSVTYIAIGNPSFSLNNTRPGDDLYTSSIVALDARTGKMKWFYQEVPHDLWDYDAASPTVLLRTRDRSGRLVDAVGEAGKTGWFYELERDTGKLIRVSDPFVPQHNIFKPPTIAGTSVAPSGYGGAVAPVAYDLGDHVVFIQAKQGTFFNRLSDAKWAPVGSTFQSLSAVDVDTGKIRWRKVLGPSVGPRTEGPLSAADLVFIGQEVGGSFVALKAKTGSQMWSFQTTPGSELDSDVPRRSFLEYLHDLFAPIKRWLFREPLLEPGTSHIHASPSAYVIDGREYIAVTADSPYRQGRSPGNTLYVFALPK